MIRAIARPMLKCSALTFLATVLTACATLGPDYSEPDVKWLERWETAASPQGDDGKGERPDDLGFWWRHFKDPALTRLIETAKRDNPSLHIAGLRVLEARAVQGIAGSSLYPQQQQVSGAVTYVDSRKNGLGDTTQTRTQASLNLGWELDFWGRFQRAIESADAAFFNSVANQQALQVLISAQVANLYFSYRITKARITIAHNNIDIQKRSFDITRQKFESGEQSELDFQQARAQYLATLSSIPQLELSLRNTRNALNLILGRPPENLPELNDGEYELPLTDTSSVENIPAYLLIRRPDIRAAAWQVAAQSAQIGIAEADYYPAISLLGTVGWTGSSLASVPNSSTVSVGPAFRWNIFDHGKIANNIRVQDARLQQLIENYQETVLQAAREVDDAATGVVKSAEQQKILDESVDAARRALDIANSRYREGYSSFQRVLDSQRVLLGQEEKQLVNRGNHLSSIVNLYTGLGGGWETADIELLIPEKTRRSMNERSDWGELLTAPIPKTPTPDQGAKKHE